MSDEPAAPDASTPSKASAARRTGTRRLSTTGGLAKGPSEDEQRRFRRKLLLGIIVAIGVLLLANLFVFVIRPLFGGKGGTKIDVGAEWQAAFDKAKEARGKISKVEEKVWVAGGTLAPEDYKEVKAQAEVLGDAADRIHELISLVREKHGEDNKESREMIQRLYQVKFWVLDATDLVDSEGKEGVDPGVSIPMGLAISRWQKAKEEFDGIVAKKAELLAKGPEEKKAVLERLEAISKVNGEMRDKLSALDAYVCEQLVNPDLSAREVPELGPPREESTLAGQVFKTIKETRADFGE